MKKPLSLQGMGCRAFTLPDVLISMTLLSLVVAGILYGHLFGMRMYEVARAKLASSDFARSTLSLVIQDIREAERVKVGTMAQGTGFVEVAWGALQQGNALELNSAFSTNTNAWVRYYLDTDRKLKRLSATNAIPTVLVECPTNVMISNIVVTNMETTNMVVFTAEDFRGNVLTNRQGRCVIALTVSLRQIDRPPVTFGKGSYYDACQLSARVAPRVTE